MSNLRIVVLLSVLIVVIAILVVNGYLMIPNKHIYTEIDISAQPETIWEILIENEKYPEWNPYHVKVEGNLKVGEKLFVEIHKPNGEKVEIDPHVMRVVPLEELTWGGGIKGIFFGEHVFLLQRLDEKSTKLIHKEDFSGLVIPFAPLDAIEEGYNLMNEALKERAESIEKNPHSNFSISPISSAN